MRSTPSSTSSRFLSTPSARRATACENHRTRPECYFYPRPPRGGRRAALRLLHPRRPISIHALREEGDATGRHHGTAATDFYPRPPRGGRRINPSQHEAVSVISIHALREEGDTSPPSTTPVSSRNFYPRPPRGGRLVGRCLVVRTTEFLSTPSARRATPCTTNRHSLCVISIHALREEGDPVVAPVTLSALPISIHALREEGDLLHVGSAQAFNISIHALREEGDVPSGICVPGVPVFLSTPSARRATASVAPILLAMAYFYPRPPRGGRPVVRAGDAATVPISIHALREEGDGRGRHRRGRPDPFLSTPSARRATSRRPARSPSSCNFYPRPPRGGRRNASLQRLEC